MKIIDLIVGTRPNFVKAAALIKALKAEVMLTQRFKFRIIHTGQHYDTMMSDIFFSQLKIPDPDVNLGVGSGSQAWQVAEIMQSYDNYLREQKSDFCIVVGDVNSTMACALVAVKLSIPVIHIESGLRSGDREMPEEINRVVTDSIATLHFTTSEHATKNLINEGICKSKIFFVGNVMIDTLAQNIEFAQKPELFHNNNLSSLNYFTLTMHRPSNVKSIDQIKSTLLSLQNSVTNFKIVFPIHPRLKTIILEQDLSLRDVIFIDPLSYHEFIFLLKNSIGVITDSGGVSEETTYLGIPCITLRNTTERPETVDIGTNVLVGNDLKKLESYIKDIVSNNFKHGDIPKKWDGMASIRIAKTLSELIK